MPPSEREVAFSKKMTEGACGTYVFLSQYFNCYTFFHALSPTRLRREPPPGGSLAKIAFLPTKYRNRKSFVFGMSWAPIRLRYPKSKISTAAPSFGRFIRPRRRFLIRPLPPTIPFRLQNIAIVNPSFSVDS